jgi:hypothetical protein
VCSSEAAGAEVPELAGRTAERLDGSGVELQAGRISADGFGWGVFALT